jgi:hypothetical protein
MLARPAYLTRAGVRDALSGVAGDGGGMRHGPSLGDHARSGMIAIATRQSIVSLQRQAAKRGECET